ncbi:hypothetical protein J1N35_036106 [Gossypium stocksii]|uniref:Reverse transcriptase zinc-binding domain-containing protein n=1 Tax=Gossypium stocksii TaxID=47602 RepID=A0A9D3UHP1_9ROSI|nr:hypothetical protein J1N35_036106 [Gossypium stocksii]
MVEGPWLRLWNSSLPPKVKDFIWRCLRNFLPVWCRLAEKGSAVLVDCVRCGGNEEIDHVFVGCPLAAMVWSLDWAAWRSAYGRLKGLSLAPFSAATVWSPPPAGLVECNVDAAIGHTARVVMSMVILSKQSRAVACCSAMFSPCVAEATSVREAFSWLKVESFDSVLVETSFSAGRLFRSPIPGFLL